MATETEDKAPPSKDEEKSPPKEPDGSSVTEKSTDEPAKEDNDESPSNPTKDSKPKPAETATPSSEQAKKKRRSDIQLNKDDHPEGLCNEDDELNDEGEKRSDPFKRAPAEVIKTRKIVSASKKWGNASEKGGSKGGIFAGVNLTSAEKPKEEDKPKDGEKSKSEAAAPASVFGSAAKVPTFGSMATSSGTFGSSFGGGSIGFGSFKSTTKEGEEKTENKSGTTFGSGFASTGFGAGQSSNGFGSNNDSAPAANGEVGAFATSTTPHERVALQSTMGGDNGEQDEDCIYDVFAKLSKLVPKEADEEKTKDSEKGESVPSVPNTEGRMELKKDDEKKEEETEDKANDKKAEAKPTMAWKEVGKGQLRILKRKTNPFNPGNNQDNGPSYARVVQRRERVLGVPILNVLLNPSVCKVLKRTDKMIQLNAPNETGKVESYLLQVKTAEDATLLLDNLNKMLS